MTVARCAFHDAEHQDSWHHYTVVLREDWRDQSGMYTAQHECKHVAVGKFHKPGENGDESDLANYRECAEALISTGYYTMKATPR